MAGTLFAAGDTHADEGERAVLQRVETAHRVAEVRIAGIDHDVAGRQIGLQKLHLLVHRITGLDHDDDRARRTYGGGEFLKRFAGDDLTLQAAGLGIEFSCRFRTAVEDGNLVAFFRYVESQVGTHNAKADKADFCLFHGGCLQYSCVAVLAL